MNEPFFSGCCSETGVSEQPSCLPHASFHYTHNLGKGCDRVEAAVEVKGRAGGEHQKEPAECPGGIAGSGKKGGGEEKARDKTEARGQQGGNGLDYDRNRGHFSFYLLARTEGQVKGVSGGDKILPLPAFLVHAAETGFGT
jgi:hypothetical protein